MIELPRSEQALKVCRDHASAVKQSAKVSDWAQLENVLASYVASTIYAESESILKAMTAERAAHGAKDASVIAFGRVAADRLIRSIKISELSGTLGLFDSSCKDTFSEKLELRQKSDWDSLVLARHGTAHENRDNGSGLTLRDIEEYFRSVKGVLESFKESLHFPSATP